MVTGSGMLPGMEGDHDPGELYTVEDARVPERTPGRVRQLLRSGDLEGEVGDASKP